MYNESIARFNVRVLVRVENSWQWYTLGLRMSSFMYDPYHLIFGRPFVNGSPYAIGPMSVCVSVCLVTLVYCDQTVAWINMPLGTEVDLDQGNIVLDGDPAPHGKGHNTPPHFSAHDVVVKRSPISATAELLSCIPCLNRCTCVSAGL